MSECELLAIVLGSGVRGRSALSIASDIRTTLAARLYSASPAELAQIPGVGLAGACRIAAAYALARSSRSDVTSVSGASDVHRRVKARVHGLVEERVWVIGVDSGNRVVSDHEIARGQANAVSITPAQVFRRPVSAAARGVVLVHNHPSGDPEPTECDVEMTHSLAAVGQLLGIPLLDHVVVTPLYYRSVFDKMSPSAGPSNDR